MQQDRRWIENTPWCAGLLGLCLMVFHLVVSQQYGFHGDELYFIVCGARPAWGYVDHPPLVPMIARVMTDLFGVHLFALRAPLAVAMGISCVLTGWLARRLGAGRFGEFLAALSFVFAPLLLRVGAFLNIPCFEVLFWLIVAHLVLTLCQRDDARWWVAIGVIAGIALLNKHTTLFLGAGLVVGMLLTPRRKDLRTPWPWIGGAIAMLIFLPNLMWQYQHDWATLEFVRTINATLMKSTSRVEFVAAQIILMNVFNAIVWISGLAFYLRSETGRPFRILGWIFLAVATIMIGLQAKVYYLTPAYPMLLAGGAVLLERRMAGHIGLFFRGALCLAITTLGLVFVPIVSPIGAIAWKDAYIMRVLGFMLQDGADLSFDFHYQHARPEQLQAFLKVYQGLGAEDQARAVILAHEYDVASNVNVFGAALGLPKGVGGNNSYHLWGPGDATGECVIAFGYKEELLRECFGEVREAGAAPGILHRADEPTRPIFVCHAPRAPLAVLWPKFKRYR